MAEKLSRHSKSEIVSKLVEDHIGDPKKILQDKIRGLAKEINTLQDRLKNIEDMETEEGEKDQENARFKAIHKEANNES